MMVDRPPLDRYRFDSCLAGSETIWGLEAIARCLGVSVSTARRWARKQDVPIYRPCGVKYFAMRSELLAWMRSR